MAAEGHGASERGAFGALVARLMERRVGGLEGEAGRAISTAHAFLILCLAVTLAYDIFYLSYSGQSMPALVMFHNLWIVLYMGAIVLARLGHQLLAALAALMIPTAQTLVSTHYVGWESGIHLFLLTAAPLVYVILTERQRAWRVIWMGVSLTAFLVCQLGMPASRAVYELPRFVLNAMFSIAALVTATLLFTFAALAHFRAEHARKLAAQSAQRAEYLANTDALTGLATRRPVLTQLEELATPGGQSYCVAIADLDRFKELNDEHGHSCGDAVLAEVGVRLRAELRVTDSVGRWGGEEFIFVLPDATLEHAGLTMDRIRAAVGDREIACAGHVHSVTVSVGVTEGEHVGTAHYAIKRADDALYRSKQEGRNRVTAVRRQPSEDAPMPRAADRRRVRGAGA
ncbi:GGDEF domain-containing protein [Demequina sp. B12]|uniref:GGDEF domain-containing protein n=1 Tax=Demequina sp. B12 TaxID=2992757 RepID=UPI00237AF518|nr:GGDEF domain-containing protein [Demequina sp. B12]MDE0572499.1 GGDEF domain-containing protein [Demequina sp. B12]